MATVMDRPATTHIPATGDTATLQREPFREALTLASRAVSTQTALPILTHALVTIGERLTITCTDSELTITAEAPAPLLPLPAFCVPAKMLSARMDVLPGTEFDLTVFGNYIEIRAGGTKFTLPTLDPIEFPRPPVVDAAPVTLPAGFGSAMGRVLPVVSDDQTRIQYTGVLLSLGETPLLVGTDGVTRVAVHLLPGLEAEPSEPVRETILPARFAKLLAGMDAAALRVTGNLISAEAAGVVVVSRVIEGQFAPWERVVPKQTEDTITLLLDKAEAVSALRRVNLAGESDQGRVEFASEADRLTLRSGFGQDFAEDFIPLPEAPPVPVSWAMHGGYLAEAIARAPGNTVELWWSAALSPVLVKTPGDDLTWRCVISPMHPR